MKYKTDKEFKKHQRELVIKDFPYRVHFWCKRLTINKKKREKAKCDYDIRYSKKTFHETLEDLRRQEEKEQQKELRKKRRKEQQRQEEKEQEKQKGQGEPKEQQNGGHVGRFTSLRLDPPDDSLSEGYYFTPKFIYTSDLVSSNDIDRLRNGLKQLLLHQYSNKFWLNPGRDVDLIDKLRSYEPGASFWSIIGDIDFGNYDDLKDSVEYAEVSVCNLNDSYFMILMKIMLTKTEQEKLSNIISENFYRKESRKVFSEHITGRRLRLGAQKKFQQASSEEKNRIIHSRKPGGRTAVVPGESTRGKTDVLDAEYDRIKKSVFSVSQKYLNLELMQRSIVQPAFVLYETNISDEDIEATDDTDDTDDTGTTNDVGGTSEATDNSGTKEPNTDDTSEDKQHGKSLVSRQFLHSMGIPDGNGKTSSSYRLYFADKSKSCVAFSHSSRYETNRYMVYIMNRIEKEAVKFIPGEDAFFINFDDYFRSYARNDYQSFLYRDFRDCIIDFRSEIGKLRITAGNYKKLLNIKNRYYKELDFYKTSSDIYDPFEGDEVLDQYEYLKDFYPKPVGLYTFFKNSKTDYLGTFFETAKKEAADKLDACKDLSDKRQDTKTNVMTIVSIVIAFISLIVAYIALAKPQDVSALQWIGDVLSCF